MEAVVTFTKVPAGFLPLSASYAGDANWNGDAQIYNGTIFSTSSLPAPTVTLTANKTTFGLTDFVTLTGTVTGTPGKTQPSGYIYFTWQDGQYYYYWTLTQGTTSSTKTFTFRASELAYGANTFIATFKGDANYSAQSSAPLVLTMNRTNFFLTTLNQEVPIAIGKSGTSTVVITPTNPFPGTVTVTCAGPTGITCTPASPTPTVGTGVNDVITINVAATTKAGIYPVVVTASGGGRIHDAQILVAAH